MTSERDGAGVHPLWWTLGLFVTIAVVVVATGISFTGIARPVLNVIVAADRTGLVMEPGGKVKLRGLQVGHVAAVTGGTGGASLKIALDADAVAYIPANVQARIKASTIFGAKYIDLVFPNDPSPQHISAGEVIPAVNVTTEVNTVFENLMEVVDKVDPGKLNATLTALADALRGKGDRLGAATTDISDLLEALTPRMDTIGADLRAVGDLGETYGAAAPDLLHTLQALSTTSVTLTRQQADLESLLLNTTGLANSGSDLLGPNEPTIVAAINKLRPTSELLLKYNPEYTCTLEGAAWILSPDGGDGDEPNGGNGYSAILDVGLGLTVDPYRFPVNLPIVGAKGGPDGHPSCGGLPRADQNLPIRALVANTGYGTGMDWRPNPGIGHPWFKNYFPTTRANPEAPYVLGAGPPAIGPVPYPGAPPYGAPLFGPDGAPLWAPPPPGAPPPPVPGVPLPPPPYGPGPGPSSDDPPAPVAPQEGQ